MAGKGKIHEHPNANTNGLDKNPQNINKTGANRSIMTEVKKKLGEVDSLTISAAEIIDAKGIPTGDIVTVRVKLDTAEAIALHYLRRAKKSDKVLIDLMDRIDGKAKQTIDNNMNIRSLSDEQVEDIYNRITKNLNEKN